MSEDNKKISVELDLDFKLLRKQKMLLIRDVLDSVSTPENVQESLQGILGILDAIQDKASEELGEEEVFGKTPVSVDLSMDTLDSGGLEAAQAVYEVLVDLLGKEPDCGGCRTFYSMDEWKARGEKYCLGAEVIVCHDGGEVAEVLSLDYGNYTLYDKFQEKLSKKGYWFDHGTNWYTGIYKLEV